MGKVISLDVERRVARPADIAGPRGQVVIFTGVRYERNSGTAPDNGSRPMRPKRKRG